MTDIKDLDLSDLKQLELGDFQRLQGLLAEAERERRKEDFEKVCLSVQSEIDRSPFTVQEVFEALEKGKIKKKALPKYRNPEDESQTWTGRGRKPAWLVEALESGKEINSFLIDYEPQEKLI